MSPEIDEDTLLEEEYWEEHTCTSSIHPFHDDLCGKPASYYLSGEDLICQSIRGGRLCNECLSAILPMTKSGEWCDRGHRGHIMINVTVKRIRF